MSLLSHRSVKALGFGLLIWIIGFVWGTIVFMVPALKGIPSITYVSNYPAISFPILVLYTVLVFYISRLYLRDVRDRISEGYKLGIILFVVNIVLDAGVYVILLGSEDYFSFLSVWISYVLMLIIPRIVAFRSQEGPTSEL